MWCEEMFMYIWREVLEDWGNFVVLTFNNSAVYLILLGDEVKWDMMRKMSVANGPYKKITGKGKGTIMWI